MLFHHSAANPAVHKEDIVVNSSCHTKSGRKRITCSPYQQEFFLPYHLFLDCSAAKRVQKYLSISSETIVRIRTRSQLFPAVLDVSKIPVYFNFSCFIAVVSVRILIDAEKTNQKGNHLPCSTAHQKRSSHSLSASHGLESNSRTSVESNHHWQSVSDTRVPRYQLHHEDDCQAIQWERLERAVESPRMGDEGVFPGYFQDEHEGLLLFPVAEMYFSVAATFWVAKLDFICCGFFPASASFFLPRTRFFRLRRFFPLPPECTFSAAKVLFCCCKVFFLAALNFSRGEAGFLLFFLLPAASISPQVSLSLFQSPVSSGVTIKFGCLKVSLLSP